MALRSRVIHGPEEQKGRMKVSVRTRNRVCLRTGAKQALRDFRCRESLNTKRSDLRNGLTRRQRVFVLEKLAGLNDKDAALAAGYSASVAENTKQRIWKPHVRAEWERLQREAAARLLQGAASERGSENPGETRQARC